MSALSVSVPESESESGGGARAAAFEAFAELALPVPLPRTFSYGIPTSLLRARPGCRARVRFGPRSLVGCIVEIREEPPSLPEGARLMPVGALLDDEPLLSPSQIDLARFIADYYLAAPGFVCRAMLPPETPRETRLVYARVEGAVEPEPEPEPEDGTRSTLTARVLDVLARPMTASALARALGKKSVSGTLTALLRKGLVARRMRSETSGGARTIRVGRITDAGRHALAEEKLHPTTIRLLTLLSVATDWVPLSVIRYELDIAKGGGPFRRLLDRGHIEIRAEEIRRTPWDRLRGREPAPSVTLTEAQRSVLREIERSLESGRFHPTVLRGVTGSGKTEIYLHAAEKALGQGRSVLMLVPEIALTPRLAALLHGRFGERVAILHSALSSGERRDEWWRIHRGEAPVVVGARAAALAPVSNLGLVVVDEEHEGSYKQEESPRYSARDVAIVRARNDGAVVVLGSATPSLESYTHAIEGRYHLLTLPDRIGERPLANVELVDMRGVVRAEGPETVLSAPLREGLGRRLSEGEQSMLLLNRRGYAGQLLCRQCGLNLQCTECSVAMTLHRQATLAVCHYCGLGRKTPERCETCGAEYLRQVGYGTERIEELVKELFPESRVARMDRDTMRRKGSHEDLLARFSAGSIDVLVGTQMLAKGHDFPAVTLVGVLAADSGLGIPDFRAAERTFQLLTQVAGRAGRGDRPGEVLIQTFVPEHYSLQYAQAQDYEGFFEAERKFRSALRYPPVVSLVNLVIEGDSMSDAAAEARRAATFLRANLPEEVKVLGPAFAVRSKIAGRHRSQILIKTTRRDHPRVRGAIRALLRNEAVARSIVVDVDPMTLA
jgi:primosomal protein N' (replication factor Y) (superfamily II helicase)